MLGIVWDYWNHQNKCRIMFNMILELRLLYHCNVLFWDYEGVFLGLL